MKKLFPFIVVLVTGCKSFCAPIIQNPYTTNSASVVDLRVGNVVTKSPTNDWALNIQSNLAALELNRDPATHSTDTKVVDLENTELGQEVYGDWFPTVNWTTLQLLSGNSTTPDVVFDWLAKTNGAGWNFNGTFTGSGAGLTDVPTSAIKTYGSDTPVAVTVGASPFNFTNLTSGKLECHFSGSVAYAITKNGAAVYGSLVGDAYFQLSSNSFCQITYSVAPTFFTNSLQFK